MNDTEWDSFMEKLKALPPLNNKPQPVDKDFWREMDAMQVSQRSQETHGRKTSHRSQENQRQ